MTNLTSPLDTFSVPLGLRAHEQAQQSRSHHFDAAKGKQVYLNTLTAIAVQDYLAMMGYTSELGDIGNPIQQTLMDCADLNVSGYGRIECRYCFEGETQSYIPPEVWSDRSGFIFVQLDESLRQAQIMGLATSIHQEQIVLDQLLPLEALSELLQPQSKAIEVGVQVVQNAVTQLQQWFQNMQDSWQVVQDSLDLFLSSSELAYRSSAIEEMTPEIGRSKPILLAGNNQAIDLTLFLGLRSLPNSDTEVWVKVSGDDRASLPLALQMSILTPAQEEVMAATSNGTEAIQFRFSAQSGEQFRLQLTLDECRWTEDFTL